MVKHLRFAR